MDDDGWLGRALRIVFRLRPQDQPELLRIDAVAERINQRSATVAEALTEISERLNA